MTSRRGGFFLHFRIRYTACHFTESRSSSLCPTLVSNPAFPPYQLTGHPLLASTSQSCLNSIQHAPLPPSPTLPSFPGISHLIPTHSVGRCLNCISICLNPISSLPLQDSNLRNSLNSIPIPIYPTSSSPPHAPGAGTIQISGPRVREIAHPSRPRSPCFRTRFV